MGLTTFHVPQPDRLSESAVHDCYMQGIDAIPWESKNSFEGETLQIQRASNESGNLYVIWPVEGRGTLTLSTTYLRESPDAYSLPVELARGTVGRLKNQIEAWRFIGINVPSEVSELVERAIASLCQAVTSQAQPLVAARAAETAIADSLDAIELMMRAYSEFALTKTGKRNVFLAANLGARSGHKFPSDLLPAINTAVVPFSWSEVEGSGGESSAYFAEQIRWCRKLNVRVCGGPLLNFDRNGLPDWLYLWEEYAESLQSCMVRYIESVVKRYAGKVSLWHAWASLNNGQAMNLSEEVRLRIGVAAIETLRNIDKSTPVFVSFNQPFGEYLSHKTLDLAPIHYADTLLRADLGIAGFGLELNLGYSPDGTLPRDVLEISRLIDRWTSLGLPLVILLSLPSTQANEDAANRVVPFGEGELNPQVQAQLANEITRACLAKPVVQGVIWNQLMDGDAPAYPSGGIFTKDGEAKPVLNSLREIRSKYLS